MELQKRREGLKILCPLLTDVYIYFAGFETRSLSENGLLLFTARPRDTRFLVPGKNRAAQNRAS